MPSNSISEAPFTKLLTMDFTISNNYNAAQKSSIFQLSVELLVVDSDWDIVLEAITPFLVQGFW